jgi:hypothetical protein
MGRRVVIVILFAGLCLGSSVASAMTERAALKLVRSAPLTVHGTAFHPGERVRVTVFTDHAIVRRIRTTAAGTFTARFSDVELSLDRCGNGLIVTARGAVGDIARLKLPQPQCPPP